VQESSLALTEMRRVWKSNWVSTFHLWFSEYLMLVHLCSWWWRQILNPSSDNWDWFRTTHQIVGAIPCMLLEYVLHKSKYKKRTKQTQ
jgi:hypothetical protein